MPKGRITKRSVDALLCPAGKDREFLWDDALCPALAWRSSRAARKSMSRNTGRTDAPRRATIGEHGRLTPDEARSEAKKLLGVVETGADPIEARRGARAVRTFGEVADDFLSLHVAAKRKSRTGAEYRRILKTIVLPAIGSKRIIDVQRADVARLHGKLVATPYEANRSLALMSAMWNWAARRGEVVVCRQSRLRHRALSRTRARAVSHERRTGAAWRGAAEGETIGLPYAVDEKKPDSKHARRPTSGRTKRLDPFAVAAIRLLILTGARLREILDAQWSHVDLERACDFPRGHKKQGESRFIFAPLRNPCSRRSHM